jgi:hypothetical protein
VQLVRSTVDFTGAEEPPISTIPGSTDKNGVQLTTNPPAAGTPVTITARFPAGDLQPWLGMLGHLIVIGPIASSAQVGAAAATAPTWAHVHAMVPLSPGLSEKPDETVAAYGPDVSFTYTFATPGQYRIWLQAERGYTVLTIPDVVNVPGSQGSGR